MDTVTRTIEYRLAAFVDETQVLEDLARKAWIHFKDSKERTVSPDGEISHCGLRMSDAYDGFAIHCARYVDDQSMGTISDTSQKQEVDIEELMPPIGKNFVKVDFMAIIKENSVICLNCHVGAKRLLVYLKSLFEKANFPEEARKFSLERVADFDKVLEISEKGVKKIEYNVVMTDLLASHFDEMTIPDESLSGQNIVDCMNDGLNNLIGGIKPLSQIRESKQGALSVGINIPAGDTEIAKLCMNEFAMKIVDEEDSDPFTIHLRKGGQVIKSDELAVTRRVGLKPWTNSVDVTDAWGKMSEFMSEVEPKYKDKRRKR